MIIIIITPWWKEGKARWAFGLGTPEKKKPLKKKIKFLKKIKEKKKRQPKKSVKTREWMSHVCLGKFPLSYWDKYFLMISLTYHSTLAALTLILFLFLFLFFEILEMVKFSKFISFIHIFLKFVKEMIEPLKIFHLSKNQKKFKID